MENYLNCGEDKNKMKSKTERLLLRKINSNRKVKLNPSEKRMATRMLTELKRSIKTYRRALK